MLCYELANSNSRWNALGQLITLQSYNLQTEVIQSKGLLSLKQMEAYAIRCMEKRITQRDTKTPWGQNQHQLIF